ncbi:MAG: sugar phosphate nucleotidyltransferase [Treponemataceae bacterium]|nr:MAG: sugar phosphate nucleotidyltransferase [Treponemataceae bacterium]
MSANLSVRVGEVDFSTLWVEKWLIPNLELLLVMDVALCFAAIFCIMKIMKPTLLVLAAGMGSRYGGVKQIDAIGLNNETLLDFATFDAKRAGYGKVVYIIRKDIEKDFRERLFDRIAHNMDAEYVFQVSSRAKPWGTVHALLAAKDVLKTPFTVINADDYYGKNAFETMGAYLSQIENSSTDHAMVGYVLEKTMSKSGSVSRGICKIKNEGGKEAELLSMRENTKISFDAGGGVVSEIDSSIVKLTGREWVSMNFFGFALSAIEHFQGYWENFYAKNANEEKAECLLPNAASEIVSCNKGKIKFFTSTENWFGMTYPEDREIVKYEIAQKIKNGYYPAVLWN